MMKTAVSTIALLFACIPALAITTHCPSDIGDKYCTSTDTQSVPTDSKLPIVSISSFGGIEKGNAVLTPLTSPFNAITENAITKGSQTLYFRTITRLTGATTPPNILSFDIYKGQPNNSQFIFKKLATLTIHNNGNNSFMFSVNGSPLSTLSGYQNVLNTIASDLVSSGNPSYLKPMIDNLSTAIMPSKAGKTFSAYTHHNCGGVILDSSHILTARHCVLSELSNTKKYPGQFFITTGTNWQTALQSEKYIKASEVYAYPILFDNKKNEYINGMAYQDYAALKLSKPLPASIGAINLDQNWQNNVIYPSMDSTVGRYQTYVAGWGDTGPFCPNDPNSTCHKHGTGSATLNNAPNTIIHPENTPVCPRATLNPNNFYDLCAGIPVGGIDSKAAEPSNCQGDSGGPLYYEKNNEFYLVGIVSSGSYLNTGTREFRCDSKYANTYAPVAPAIFNQGTSTTAESTYVPLCTWLKNTDNDGPGLSDLKGC